jgi:hypothetical protein
MVNISAFDSNDAGGHATIEHSVLSGTSGSLLSVGFGSAYLASTRLEGSVDVGGEPSDPPPVCAGVYDALFTFYASTCPYLFENGVRRVLPVRCCGFSPYANSRERRVLACAVLRRHFPSG